MNVFDQLAPFVPQMSTAPDKAQPQGASSSTSLTSPPFDETGQLYGPQYKTQSKSTPDRSLVPPSLLLDKPVAHVKAGQTWQRNQIQRSTLPRTKPKSESSPYVFSPIASAGELNSLKPSTKYIQSSPSLLRRPSTFLHKLCLSPTLTARLSPTTPGMQASQQQAASSLKETPASILKTGHGEKDHYQAETPERCRPFQSLNQKGDEGRPRTYQRNTSVSYLRSSSPPRQAEVKAPPVQGEVTTSSKQHSPYSDASHATYFSQEVRRLPATPPVTRPACSPHIEARRQQFDRGQAKEDILCPNISRNLPDDRWSSPPSKHNRTIQGNVQKPGLRPTAQSQKTQMDRHKCVTGDSSCHSRDRDQCPCATSRYKTFREEHLNWKATFRPKPDIIHHVDDSLAETGPFPTDLLAPAHHDCVSTKLLEPSSEKCSRSHSATHDPLNANSFGTGSKGSFNLPPQLQHRVNQRPETTAVPVSENHATEPEDPDYVTMYYPGSVYVGSHLPAKPAPAAGQWMEISGCDLAASG
ncbi:uncharacterized protein ACB058_014296 [Synchiropus picturatus]